MPHVTRTWWGERFLQSIETFADAGRLQRGRSYNNDYRLLTYKIENGRVSATVRGNINHYYGVHKEPKYRVSLTLQPISKEEWSAIAQHLGSRVGALAKLLLDEMPEDIEDSFSIVDRTLLPTHFHDFEAKCSCPDWSYPCKHLAGVMYRIAQDLDRDPLLLFELRGLSREELKEELTLTPLGLAIADELDASSDRDTLPEPDDSLFTRPGEVAIADLPPNPKDFWQSPSRLPASSATNQPAAVSAIAIKKQGDYPEFWPKQKSFIAMMEALYLRVKTKTKDLM
ncbi:MAG: SWIM zinc finger family protein [Cyanobacteria bacterium J06639_1]